MRPLLIGLATLIVLVAGGVVLLQVVVARDDADVATPSATGPGERVEGVCADSATPIARDRADLTRAQIDGALQTGNVVLLSRDPGKLAPIQRRVSGPYDAELAAAGQMVVLGRSEDPGVTALAFGRRLEAASPDDPELREFAESWLGNTNGRDSCG